MVRMLFPPGPKGVGDRGEGEEEEEDEEEENEEEEEECTRPFWVCEENDRALPVCCEGVGSLRDPLDREGMWEEGWEPERGAWEDRMEDFVTEEEEEEEEGLLGLVASEFCADWELPLVELG